jgi:beta-glucanase (GH16 family)
MPRQGREPCEDTMPAALRPALIFSFVTVFLAATLTLLSARAEPAPVGVPGKWSPVFADEFNGTKLDLTRWRPNWLGADDGATTAPVNDAESSCYDPRQVAVGGGSLQLTAVARRCTAGGRTYQYASGLIQSRHDFTFTYGYAEARILLPRNKDSSKGAVGSCAPNWAAFWLNGLEGDPIGEIDVMECLGNDIKWHYHWDDYDRSATSQPMAWDNGMPPGEWHTFGVNWSPGRLDFYYDGSLVGRHRVGVTSDPHYLVVNLAVSDPHITTPQTMRIDYLRVWRPR